MSPAFDGLYTFAFVTTALVLFAVERIPALRFAPAPSTHRWTSNLTLFVAGTLVSAAVLPAVFASLSGRSPFAPAWDTLGMPLALVLGFLLLDLLKYWEHRLFHAAEWLWRLHLVHHSDTALDVTTSQRHHPLEVAVSVLFVTSAVALLGVPAAALGVYLVVAVVVTLASHANLRPQDAADRWLRRALVTPAVHAVHHSALRVQTDSNFGSVLTLWDRLFGTYVDPAQARVSHVGLSYFHRAREARVLQVLAQPFAFRRGLDDPDRSDDLTDAVADDAAPAGAWAGAAKGPLFAGALGALIVVVAMGPAAASLAAAWRDHEAYQYAWLVVPMVVYILGWHWRPPPDVRPDFSGTIVVAAGAVCWVASTLTDIEVGRQLALVVALQGVAMSTFGWTSYRRLFPAFALLFLMIPSGDILEAPLRAVTFACLGGFATLAGLPHSAEGYVLLVAGQRYFVAPECAGLTFVALAAFLGYAFGLLVSRSLPKILAMALLGALVGIGSNTLRVCTIVLVDRLRGTQMDLAAHGVYQWLALLAGLGVLFFVLSRLEAERPVDPAPEAAPARGAAGRAARIAPVIAGLSGLLVTGCVAQWQGDDGSTPASAVSDAASPALPPFPPRMARWVRDGAPSERSLDAAHQIETLRATYADDTHAVSLVAMQGLSTRVKLSTAGMTPQDRPPWRERQADDVKRCAPWGCVSYVHATFERDHGTRLRHVYYAYALGGRITDSRLVLRALQGWQRLTGDPAPARLIALVSDGRPVAQDDVAAGLRALADATDPALRR